MTADKSHSRAEKWREVSWVKVDGVLLDEAAADARRGGPVWKVLGDYLPAPLLEVMLPLRFMAAMHSLVLREQAPDLARFYPSMKGEGNPDEAWPAFLAALNDHLDEVHASRTGPYRRTRSAVARRLSAASCELPTTRQAAASARGRVTRGVEPALGIGIGTSRPLDHGGPMIQQCV